MLAACAREAPDLPPQATPGSVVLTSGEVAQSCADVDTMIASLRDERNVETAKIKANRRHNQVAGYLGALFIVPIVVAEHNQAEKERLDEIQAQLDHLTTVRRAKDC